MARCNIAFGPEGEADLTICEPESGDDAAKSLTISGLEALITLRELINDEIADAEERRELAGRASN
jgi:predicted ArsR family transcriptional regulator